jgi:hypothetical protein
LIFILLTKLFKYYFKLLTTMMGNCNDDKGTKPPTHKQWQWQGLGQEDQITTHHPPPASQATAHGVDHRWIDNNNEEKHREGVYEEEQQNTTHPQPHEQLLMGWIPGGTTSRMNNNTPPAPAS